MRRLAALVLIALAGSSPALAHSSARGFVLLLPTSYVILGGGLAVLASFLVLSLLPRSIFAPSTQVRGLRHPQVNPGTKVISFTTAAILAALIVVGFMGPQDPLENLLPLSVWTLWWVVIVLLHPLLGNLWDTLNPFAALYAWSGAKPLLNFGQNFDYVPAVCTFAAFAWFQLVYPAPEDPERLAMAVLTYVCLTTMAIVLFGYEMWMKKGDPFGIFLYQLGAAAPVDTAERISFRFPGMGLVELGALPLAGTFFVLLSLSSISFDGLANTFLWLSAIGVNPLDYPGRMALVPANTFGMAASFAALAMAYAASVAVGWQWAGRPGRLITVIGRFVFSLIPISIAYHFAHYLSDAMVNLQYLALALNDPLGIGADLLNLGHYHVTASFQNTSSGALAIFAAQTGAIIFGHIVGIAVAHAIAVRQKVSHAAALQLEAPLAILMVIYTCFGLWLLSTPAIS